MSKWAGGVVLGVLCTCASATAILDAASQTELSPAPAAGTLSGAEAPDVLFASLVSVSEPGTLVVIGLALVCLAWFRRGTD